MKSRRLLVSTWLGISVAAVASVAPGQHTAPSETEAPTFVVSDDDPATRHYWASFSPDGGSVLFSQAPTRGGKWELFVVPVSGGEPRPLADEKLPVSATRASWSETGLIAFTGGTRNGQQQLWLIDAEGTGAEHVTAAGLSKRVLYPSWEADGETLVVLDAGKKLLQRVDLVDLDATPLTDPDDVLVGMPSASPAGDWIAFAGQKNVGKRYDQTRNSIYLVDVDGGKARSAEPKPLLGRTPAWSPDGAWIAFESNRGNPGARGYAIFVMRVDGSGLRRLTPYSWNANHPMFSRDGRHLVFSARDPSRAGVSGIAILDFAAGDPPPSPSR